MSFPIVKPMFSEALDDFNQLKDNSFKGLMRKEAWYSRYEYKHKLSRLYISSNIAGLKSSNYFHFDARMCCDSINSPSPIRSWFNPKFKEPLKDVEIANGNMASAIALRKYIASQFKPSAAKCLFEKFKARDVYDPCMGFGDRLSAALATDTVKSYTGLDVNPHLFLGYEKQVELNSSKKVNYIFERAEKHIPPEKSYDFVFTSPPYYDVERYEGMWQSHLQYKKFDDWMKKFLFKMLENTWTGLKDGGVMAINISDVYCHHKVHNICDPMVDHILTFHGAEYIGAIGYQMNKRPNSKATKQKGIFAEPIWCFRKNL